MTEIATEAVIGIVLVLVIMIAIVTAVHAMGVVVVTERVETKPAVPQGHVAIAALPQQLAPMEMILVYYETLLNRFLAPQKRFL